MVRRSVESAESQQTIHSQICSAHATSIDSWIGNSSTMEASPSMVCAQGSRVDSGVVNNFTLAAKALGMPDVPKGRFASAVVQHKLFRNGITCVVILGAIQMGFEVELQDPAFTRVWEIWGVCYTVISTTEMFLMIDAYRSIYFTTTWMFLDFLLAMGSILCTFVLPAANLPGGSLFRMLRLLRVLRIIKVTTVFPAFSVIVEGLKGSFISIFWILALSLLILYAGGICCVDVLGGQDAGYPAYSKTDAHIVEDFNNFVYFGTLSRSMLTLLGIMLLDEWSIVRQVAEVNLFMIPFFLFLLVVVTFGVLNVIIGIVAEKTTEAMSKPQYNDLLRSAVARTRMSEELSDVFDKLDVDCDCRLSAFELEQGIDEDEFVRKLQKLDLPHNFTFVEFLGMLDSNGDGYLSKHEFVSGLVRLNFSNDWQRECLHAMEIGMLRQDMKRLGEELKVELKRSVRELKSEFRRSSRTDMLSSKTSLSSFALSGIGSESVKLAWESEMPIRPGVQSSSAQWEPLAEQIFAARSCSSTLVHCQGSATDQIGAVDDSMVHVQAGASSRSTSKPLKAGGRGNLKVETAQVKMPSHGVDGIPEVMWPELARGSNSPQKSNARMREVCFQEGS